MKRFFILFIICCVIGMASCKKDNIPSNGNEIIVPPSDTSTTQILYSGSLIGGEAGDQARGDVTVERVGSRKYLVFRNFNSNSGPDVHVYFSKTIGSHASPPTEYKDLGFLKYTSGTFNYELLTDPDISNYKYVLIWCAQYRIQFGYTELK
ncbi:MAG: DM13 domain-containing protein [Chitinophagaceae bacterium]|nr:DM13 domain-containing protein [Chitinophagaceae bacterium]